MKQQTHAHNIYNTIIITFSFKNNNVHVHIRVNIHKTFMHE